jgi:hypothetical protein
MASMLITVEHDKDGMADYNEKGFKLSQKLIKNAIISTLKYGISPRIGEMVYGDDDVYYIVKICYYSDSITYWVSEENISEFDKI